MKKKKTSVMWVFFAAAWAVVTQRGACVTPARAVTKETTFLINRPQFVLSNNSRPLLSLS